MHGGQTPFIFNPVQQAYYDDVWLPWVAQDFQPKPRKYGFTTLRGFLGYHTTITSTGHTFRVVLHRRDAAGDVKNWLDNWHECALSTLRDGYNIADPYEYLPKLKYDNRREFTFESINSRIIVESAQGDAVGQSDVSHDVYLAEYSHWPKEKAATIRKQVMDSIPAAYPYGRVSLDFNANVEEGSQAMSTDARTMYKAIVSGGTDWTLVFFPVTDFPEVWSREWLEKMWSHPIDGAKNRAIYPAKHSHMWIQPTHGCFKWELLDAAHEMTHDEYGDALYLVDQYDDDFIRQHEIAHGIDTSEGYEDSDWQCMKSRALVRGVWREIEPPLYCKKPEDVFAREAHERWIKWGGLAVVERNKGQAVLALWLDWPRPQDCILYRDTDPVKPGKRKNGLYMTGPRKRTMIARYNTALREGAIDMPDAGHVQEAKAFIWLGHVGHVAGAPPGEHDDKVDADMILLDGVENAPPPPRALRKKR